MKTGFNTILPFFELLFYCPKEPWGVHYQQPGNQASWLPSLYRGARDKYLLVARNVGTSIALGLHTLVKNLVIIDYKYLTSISVTK